MPILFGLIGNAMRFKTLPHNIIPKACAIIFAGSIATLQNGPVFSAHGAANCCAFLCLLELVYMASLRFPATAQITVNGKVDLQSIRNACQQEF